MIPPQRFINLALHISQILSSFIDLGVQLIKLVSNYSLDVNLCYFDSHVGRSADYLIRSSGSYDDESRYY
jgi:hypothetical protein